MDQNNQNLDYYLLIFLFLNLNDLRFLLFKSSKVSYSQLTFLIKHFRGSIFESTYGTVPNIKILIFLLSFFWISINLYRDFSSDIFVAYTTSL